MEIQNVYRKVVEDGRGGFCYELNLLFHELLKSVGFTSHIISARILNENGTLGPEYDHMVVYIDLGTVYIADVGYGDLFVKPLEVKAGIQTDGRNFFILERQADDSFLLSMSATGKDFQNKYTFTTKKVSPNAFLNLCADKQTNPDSYFVQNTVCTKPTPTGRITIFNNKLIETNGDQRIELLLETEEAFRKHLKDRFGIEV
jgi:N-hydroxyarylamine O-acetyltransferase